MQKHRKDETKSLKVSLPFGENETLKMRRHRKDKAENMAKAALAMSIVSLVFSAVTLALLTLSFVMKRNVYYESN